MRKTIAYVLRLLIDEAEPEALRGTLRNVNSGEEHSFSTEQALLELLRTQVAHNSDIQDFDQFTQPRRSEP
jgi:hypothetical protein